MNGSPKLENHLSLGRLLSLLVLVVLIFVIYFGRLINLQILQGGFWTAKAEDNRTTELSLQAARGIIYDRNGYILARNIPSYNIVITWSELPDDIGEIQQIFRELSPVIGVPVSRSELTEATPFVECISDHGITQIAEFAETSYPFSPVNLACDVDQEVAMIVKEKEIDWPGISVEIVPIRDYPTGSLTASIIGYLGPISEANEAYYRAQGFIPNRDKVGYAGLERTYQEDLAGVNGRRLVEVNVGGEILYDREPPTAPEPGLNLRLTIDTRFQQASEAILVSEIEGWNAYWNEMRYTSGVVIAINPQTGEILSMISWPTYENNRLARFIPTYYYRQLEADARKPLLNHAVGDELPAGSVFKLATALGALNEKVVTPEQVIKTPGQLTIVERYSPQDPGKERYFVDWNWRTGGFGQLDFLGGLANSSNVYFYKLGGGYEDEVPEGLGICRLGTYARALGYGDFPFYRDTSVEGEEFYTGLPEEADGLIPDPEYKRRSGGESWTLGDTYIVSVGQGYVLASPMQVLLSAATIANDGKLMYPTFVREIVDGEGNVIQPFEPRLRWDITQDPIIEEYEAEYSIRGCETTGELKTVEPWVVQKIQEGMRMAVTEGTLSIDYIGFSQLDNAGIAAAGKTGTAEYCDQYALAKNLCEYGNWPSHAWTVAYAPYDNPEIAVVAFVYNGQEGAGVAGPIVRKVLSAYFELKDIDQALLNP
jgi:penicillin-binding protein 2